MAPQSPAHTSILNQTRSPPPAPESLSASSLTSALLPKLQQLRPAQLVTTLRALASLHHQHPHTLEQLANAVMLADTSHASHNQTHSSTQQQQQPDQLHMHMHSHQPAYSQSPSSQSAAGTSAFSPGDWGHILSAFSTLRHEPQLLLPHAARVIAMSLHDTNIRHTSLSQAPASGTAVHGHIASSEAADVERPPAGTSGPQQRALPQETTSSKWGAAELASVLLPFAMLQHHAPHLFGSAASRLSAILQPFHNSSPRSSGSWSSRGSSMCGTSSTSNGATRSSGCSPPGSSGDWLSSTTPPPPHPNGPSPGSGLHHHPQGQNAAGTGDGKPQDPSKLVTCLWAYASLADPAVVGLAAAAAAHTDSLLPALRLPALCSLAWSLSVAVALSGGATAAAAAAAATAATAAAQPHDSEAGQGQPGWRQPPSPTTPDTSTQLPQHARIPGAAVDAPPPAHAALPRSSETAAVLSLLQRVVAAAEPAATSQLCTQGVSSSAQRRRRRQRRRCRLPPPDAAAGARAAAGPRQAWLVREGRHRHGRCEYDEEEHQVGGAAGRAGVPARDGPAGGGRGMERGRGAALRRRAGGERGGRLLERPPPAAQRTHAAPLSPPRGSEDVSGRAGKGGAVWGEDRRRSAAPPAAEGCDGSSGNARDRRRAARSGAAENGGLDARRDDGPAGLQGRLMQLQQRLQGGGLQAAALQALAAGGHSATVEEDSSSGAGARSIQTRDMGCAGAACTHPVSRAGEGTEVSGGSGTRGMAVRAGRVAVEVDGPQHFCATPRLDGTGGVVRRRNGKTELRDALLRQRFSALVCVSTAEWRGVRGGEAGRRAFLTRLLRAALPPPSVLLDQPKKPAAQALAVLSRTS
ncbi:MAG: hypothetical protein WDW38_002213 [Sanguina aurantia]